MKQTSLLLASAFAALFVAASASHASTLNIYQGADLSGIGLGVYSGADNLTLIEGLGSSTASSRNYGALNSLTIGRDTQAGQRRGLLRFDLTALEGVIDNISSVSLTMTLLNLTGSNSKILGLNLYEVASANSDWVQGTGSGSAQAGSASWSYREIPGTGVPAVGWAGSAGLGTAGTDYVNTVIDGAKTVTAGATGITGTTVTWTLSKELIEQWIAGDNAGLLFTIDGFEGLANGDYLSMAVGANANADYRPTLVINYAAIPEPGTVGLMLGSVTLLGLFRGLRRRGA